MAFFSIFYNNNINDNPCILYLVQIVRKYQIYEGSAYKQMTNLEKAWFKQCTVYFGGSSFYTFIKYAQTEGSSRNWGCKYWYGESKGVHLCLLQSIHYSFVLPSKFWSISRLDLWDLLPLDVTPEH